MKLRESILRSIENETFGDFRQPILDTRTASFNRDYDAAQELFNKLYKQMFT